MFNANDLKIAFAPINAEPQLVIIPVNNEYGVVAVVKSLGGGKAACIAFSPATKLDNPFQGYRPTFLRKVVTTDFPMREGRWKPLSIDAPSTLTLRSAVISLFKDFDHIAADSIKQIDMRRPTNVSSSPEVSSQTYSTPENVQFEKALGHLVGIEFTMARAIAKQQTELNIQATAAATAAKVEVVVDQTEIQAPTGAPIEESTNPMNAQQTNPGETAIESVPQTEAHAGSSHNQNQGEASA